MESIASTPSQMSNSQYKVRGMSSISERASNVIFQLLWHFLHLLATIWHFALDIIYTLQSYCISSGLLVKYKDLDLANLHNLAIVVESQEAYDTLGVVKLLRWLSNIGVKYICLYDMDGVLKRSKKIILKELGDKWQLEGDKKGSSLDQTLEFASLSDGKEAITKAANFLCTRHLEVCREESKPVFTEADMTQALTAVGCGEPDVSLLLVYGPVRCHLGFPPWRLRYTEIVHMGPLKSTKYGAILKAIHKFAKVHQNYGV